MTDKLLDEMMVSDPDQPPLRAELILFRAETRSEFKRVNQKLDSHSKILDEHSKVLDEHSRVLAEHSRILDQHTKSLDLIANNVAEILRRV